MFSLCWMYPLIHFSTSGLSCSLNREPIMDKINRQDNMTAQEYSYAQFLLIHGFINECKVYWCNLLLKALVDGTFHIEYSDLEDLIILLSNELIKKGYSLQDVKISIIPFQEDFDKESDGKSYRNEIYINDRLIRILFM